MEEPNKSFFDDEPKKVPEEPLPEQQIPGEDGAASEDGEQERIPHPSPDRPADGRGESLAMFSVVLGLASFVCCGLFSAIAAIVTALMARHRMKRMSAMALAGLLLGIVYVLLMLFIAAVVFFLLAEGFGEAMAGGELFSFLAVR